MESWARALYRAAHGAHCPLVVVPVLQVAFNVVGDFDASDRGAGGFGSTGKH
jgi:dUTPase